MGVLSEVDLMEIVVQDSYYNENAVSFRDFMQVAVEHVEPDMDILNLAQRFVRNHRRRYPVLQDGVLIGQISRETCCGLPCNFFWLTDARQPLSAARSQEPQCMRRSALELGADDFIDLLRIGLALGGLHDLAQRNPASCLCRRAIPQTALGWLQSDRR